MKNGLIFYTSWFIGSTVIGMVVGHQLRRMRQRHFDQPPLKGPVLVIPAHGPTYIYAGTSFEHPAPTYHKN